MPLDLEKEAADFGQELQQLLDDVLPYLDGTDPALRQVTVTREGLWFAVEIGTSTGKAVTIPLLSNGEKTAELFVQIRLVADTADRYPAVAKSKFEVRIERHPLLRLDFQRGMHTVPGCHWNVHAERGAVTRLLARNKPDHNGELAKVHLPVGGVRMRPGLEDVLQLLTDELGFDALPGARAAIEAGRVKWRRRQLAAMVRDDPNEAVRVLTEELGFDVTAPKEPPPTNIDRLRRW